MTTSALPAASIAKDRRLQARPFVAVVACTVRGKPAPRAACRAGAWPSPAASTQPITICSILSGSTRARRTAAPIAAAPSSVARRLDRRPRKAPIGVRA
jgi:hypothetical protein